MSTTITETGITRYSIDPAHSQVGFSVKHMAFSTVRGDFRVFDGTILVDDEFPTNSSVIVTIDASSISTGNEKRDTHLRSADFFDVATYPEITFKSTLIEYTSQDDFTVRGELTMHGITKPVQIKSEQIGEGTNPSGVDVIGFEGSTKVNRKEFGLNWNTALEKGGVLVGDEVTISLELQAAQQ